MNLSIIAPAYNEQEVLPFFFKRVEDVCEALLHEHTIDDYEVLLVDDGSTDLTWSIIRETHTRNAKIQGIKFSRNFGHHGTTVAGLDHATGDFLVFMDSDLQAQPEDIPKLIEQYKLGNDVVWGVAKERKDNPLICLSSKFFYWGFNKIAGVKIFKENVMAGCSRVAASHIRGMREVRQFAPAIWNYVGFRHSVIELEKKERFRGSVKYNFRKRLSLALVSVVGFSKFPLKISSILGFVMSVAGISLGMYIVIVKLMNGVSVPGYTSLFASMMFFLGIQFLILGIIGEYVGTILDEVKRRPIYIVEETLCGK